VAERELAEWQRLVDGWRGLVCEFRSLLDGVQQMRQSSQEVD
jgi:hypothetical protein